jgi:hypothetical protein
VAERVEPVGSAIAEIDGRLDDARASMESAVGARSSGEDASPQAGPGTPRTGLMPPTHPGPGDPRE